MKLHDILIFANDKGAKLAAHVRQRERDLFVVSINEDMELNYYAPKITLFVNEVNLLRLRTSLNQACNQVLKRKEESDGRL